MDSNKQIETKTDDFEAGRSDFIQNFKSDLNNFLYQHVPGKMTLDEFECLTVSIHERVWDEWKKFV